MESNCSKWPWGQYVKDTLEGLGLSNWWDSHGISYSFENKLKKSIARRELTLWLHEVHSKPKLRIYRTIKSDLDYEDYLSNVTSRVARSEITKLRGGTNRLNIEVGRWRKLEVLQRLCGVCGTGSVENEPHFMLECFPYESVRKKMFEEISVDTKGTLKLEHLRQDQEFMMNVLLGFNWKDTIWLHGVEYEGIRTAIQYCVGRFILRAMIIRARILDDSQGD